MAVILNSEKFIFIHIPKNGGTSISRLLQPEMKTGDILVMEGGQENTDTRDVFPPKYNITKHAPALNFAMWLKEGGECWEDYTSLAIIREPVSRAVSVYYELAFHGHAWAPYQAGIDWWMRFKGLAQKEDGLSEFITSGLYTPDSPILLCRPQRWMVHDMQDKIIVSYLADFEHIDELPAILGATETPLPKDNIANYTRRLPNDEAIGVLRDKYAMDFALYADIAQR